MEKELTAARSLARERQQKISFLNAVSGCFLPGERSGTSIEIILYPIKSVDLNSSYKQ